MTHSDVTEDLANNKEKGEEIQQAQAGPAVTDQVLGPGPYLLLFILLSVLWIRIQWGPGIRIMIRIHNPDPGEQKGRRKIENSYKFLLLGAGLSLFVG